MKLSDIFERKKLKTRKGEPGQFEATLKGSGGESVLVSAYSATQEEADAALLEQMQRS